MCPLCGWRSDSTAGLMGHACSNVKPQLAWTLPERPAAFTVNLSPGFFFGDARYSALFDALTAQRQRREDAKARRIYVGGWARATSLHDELRQRLTGHTPEARQAMVTLWLRLGHITADEARELLEGWR